MAELTEISEREEGIDNRGKKYSFSEVKARCRKIAEGLEKNEGGRTYLRGCWSGIIELVLGESACLQIVRKGKESNIFGMRKREVLLEVRYTPMDYQVYPFHEGVLPLVDSFFE